MLDSKKILLYADERNILGKEVIGYLMNHDVKFTVIPTEWNVPFLTYGAARYDGYQEIKTFVEKLKLKVIVVEKRGEVYYAFVEGSPEVSGFGDIPQVAIGNLVSSRKKLFGISEIKYPHNTGQEIRSELTTEMENAICHPPVPWEEIEKTEKMVQDLVERFKTRQHK